MDTIMKGRLGYNLLEKELLKREWDLYTPVLENTKIDCIAIKGDVLLRMQIKTLQSSKSGKALPVRKINHNQGEYKVHFYNKSEIDYFIGVDLETEDLYLVPIEFSMKYKSSISVNTLAPFKNNFSQLEPHSRNIMSGCDDIGEPLTGNTEGM